MNKNQKIGVAMGIVLSFILGFSIGYFTSLKTSPKPTPELLKPPDVSPVLPFQKPEFVLLSEEERAKAEEVAEEDFMVSKLLEELGEYEVEVENGVRTPHGLEVNVVYHSLEPWIVRVVINLEEGEVIAIRIERKREFEPLKDELTDKVLKVARSNEEIRGFLEEKFITKFSPPRENEIEVFFIQRERILKVRIDLEKGELLNFEIESPRRLKEEPQEPFELAREAREKRFNLWFFLSAALALMILALITYLLIEKKKSKVLEEKR
ncbi:MAG: hypothetical protein ACE5K0_02025 [Candidatus Methanofastidiosia archaeon]